MQLPTLLKFKVHSLNQDAFSHAAQELSAQAHAFNPNIIVGIRSGGYALADLMVNSAKNAQLLAITCRRPGTQNKNNSVVKTLISKLPHVITDRLRIAEHILLTQVCSAKDSPAPAMDAQEMAEIEKALKTHGADARILIVDDAVDRGTTLLAVRNAIKSVANPAAVIKMAAITVTTASPLIEPDFSLYRYVLCRFPWSLDARN